VEYIPYSWPEIDASRICPAVLVLPGGGYGFASDRENEPMALKFASEGV